MKSTYTLDSSPAGSDASGPMQGRSGLRSSRTVAAAAALLLFSNLPVALAVTPASDFGPEYVIDIPNSGTAAVEVRARLHIPADTTTPKPLIIFLHGAGERGDDNAAQVNGNVNNLFNNAKNKAYILAPQCPAEADWTPAFLRNIMMAAAKIMTEHNVAPDKIYITGLSMGGAGTWTSLMHYTIFAAGIPICGASPQGGQSPATMAGVPIWAFHAVNDSNTFTSVNKTRARVNDIRNNDGLDNDGFDSLDFPLDDDPNEPFYNTGAPYYTDGTTFYDYNNLRYSEYKTGDHGIWGRVYGGGTYGELYTWLWSQSYAMETLEVGETLLYDFGTTVLPNPTTDKQGWRLDSSNRIWNCTGSTGVEQTQDMVVRPAFAKTDDTVQTGIMLKVTTPFSGSVGTGMTAAGPLYDANVVTDAWRTNLSASAGMTFYGLVPGATYELRFFATENDSDGSYGRAVRYYVDSTHFADLESAQVVNNTTNQAVISGVQADSNGRISFQVMPKPGSTSRYGLVSAMELTRLPDPGPAAMFSQNFNTWANLGDYIATPPAVGQFDDLQTNGAGTGTPPVPESWSIAGGRLQAVRTMVTNACGFTRLANPSLTPTALKVKFKLRLSAGMIGNAFGDLAVFDIGNITGITGYSGNPPTTSIANRLILKGAGSAGYRLRINATDSVSNYSFNGGPSGTPLEVEWYTNQSGSPLNYAGPTGAQTLASGASDLWINGVKAIDGVLRNSGYTNNLMGGFRFRFPAVKSNSTDPDIVLDFDDLEIVPLN